MYRLRCRDKNLDTNVFRTPDPTGPGPDQTGSGTEFRLPLNFSPPRNEFLTPRNEFLTPQNDFLTPQNDFLTPQNDFLTPQNDFLTPRTRFFQKMIKMSSKVTKKVTKSGQKCVKKWSKSDILGGPPGGVTKISICGVPPGMALFGTPPKSRIFNFSQVSRRGPKVAKIHDFYPPQMGSKK